MTTFGQVSTWCGSCDRLHFQSNIVTSALASAYRHLPDDMRMVAILTIHSPRYVHLCSIYKSSVNKDSAIISGGVNTIIKYN